MLRERWLTVSALVLGFDQFTKYLSVTHLNLADRIPVWPGFDLTLRYNAGAAFSFLADAAGWQRGLFIVFGLVVSVVIYIWLGKLTAREKQTGFALAFILGGACGNTLDRINDGRVVDYLLFYYKDWEWPAFNLADTAICLGVLLLAPVVWKKQG